MESIVVFDEVATKMAEFKVENEKIVFNYQDEEGNKQARSHIASIRKFKTRIAEVHKEAKAESLAYGRRLDEKKRELTGEVDGWIKVHKDPLDAIEAEQQAKIDAEKKRLEDEEAVRLAEIEAREVAVREGEAKLAAEKAEVERLEREKRIAAEAAEKAKAEAEARAKGEANAKELAEKNRIEAEVAKEKKRVENKKHREKIEGEVHFALTEIGFEFVEASNILTALKENRIPNVTINY